MPWNDRRSLISILALLIELNELTKYVAGQSGLFSTKGLTRCDKLLEQQGY